MDVSSVIEDLKFLEHGRFELLGVDKEKRISTFRVDVPQIIFVQVHPSLLNCASISSLRISEPLAIWQPKITAKSLKSNLSSDHESILSTFWEKFSANMNQSLIEYSELVQVLKNPDDITQMLPMGTYINFTMVCNLDKIPGTLVELQKAAHVSGVLEFQFAFSAAMARALTLIEAVS